jgi:hypothetical protein
MVCATAPPGLFHCQAQTAPATCAVVEALRRQRYTGKQIAVEVDVSPATVSRILRRLGINKLSALEPPEPVRRYEREHPGEIIHIDIKKLGRFEQVGHRITGDRQIKSRRVGWQYLHLAIDDHSRVAYSEILPDEKRRSCLTPLPMIHRSRWQNVVALVALGGGPVRNPGRSSSTSALYRIIRKNSGSRVRVSGDLPHAGRDLLLRPISESRRRRH